MMDGGGVSAVPLEAKTSMVMVEDNLDLARTIQDFLGKAPQLCLMGSATGEASFKSLIAAHLPELALIDIGLDHPRSGLDLLVWLAREFPVVKPVIMTVNQGDVLEAYQRGARGYVLKTQLEILVPTLLDVSQGTIIIPPGVSDLLMGQMAEQAARWKTSYELMQLSEREREILALLKQGVTREDIAERLSISYFTVRRHIQNVLEKTGQPSVREVLKKFGEVLGTQGPLRGLGAD
jgi:DNA-binding NarL/FixJ family response regulator